MKLLPLAPKFLQLIRWILSHFDPPCNGYLSSRWGALARLCHSLARVKTCGAASLRGRNIVFRKSRFRWIRFHRRSPWLVDQSSPNFFHKCARDPLSQDRNETWDPCLRYPDETETFIILCETRPRRNIAASETLAETFKLPRLSGASAFRRDVFRDVWWNTLKMYGLINSHHGKRFLFVILWVFALYFDNYHWIINGLHHKELQLRCWRHEPLCLSQFASN